MNRQLKQQATPWMTVFWRKITGRPAPPVLCEQCGARPFVTEWAGNGRLICLQCCDQRRADSLSMPEAPSPEAAAPGAAAPESGDPLISDPAGYVYVPWARPGGHEPGEPGPGEAPPVRLPSWAWPHEALDAPVSD